MFLILDKLRIKQFAKANEAQNLKKSMKRYFLLVGFLVTVFFFVTCSKNSTQPTSYDLYVYYKNSSGQDLLDPSTPNYMPQRKVDVSWLVTSTTVGVFQDSVFLNKDSSLPKGYCFEITDNKSTMGLVKYVSLGHPIATDTLTFTYSGTTLQTLKYNSTVIVPQNGGAYPAKVAVVVTR